ncbi:aldehyde dehydrogenase family protein [Phyllobacterium myrsinacearum]|uniref:Aldehyde dehydrogenase n=1 Tax=Phyllobacterium myrsinacearum TaxID=28101 RepID=A0A2S9JQW5_9HYPH|nr:aldehyde dehydrogenase family protein [Phyllobacterium myrsinacearum]PRD55549.1 aldehyde dehydrogenase [Phyllobacterium myrsinacearum]PWV91904.1 succinate-semialdehyde dehydrogenase/glutarate-semialdehyde dehydrogenase [Phyllobacterium myrsinacearum]RZV05971.1 succinate-semialdehyde dehydrogenase/glutarate-semialdehyde dehydrogenase [Phyllobacterium myrsinacearum]
MPNAITGSPYELSRTELFPGNYIAGQWEDQEEGRLICRNPSNNEILGELPNSGRDAARRAIAAAAACQKEWTRTSQWERADLCEKLGNAIKARQDELARLLSLEQGKPLAEAHAEVGLASHGFHMAAQQVRYMTGEVLHGTAKGRQVISHRHPRGVYAVITPWNFPVNIPVEYIAPGIATGNAIVWVPAPSTSLVAVALMRVLHDAGIPQGLVNLVVGEGAIVGDEIVSNTGTHAIGFTGSTKTGQIIAQRGAGKPMILELGGNGPLIVRKDADLEKAAAAAAVGAFTNCGQICSATGRVLADRHIAFELAERIAALAEAQVLGNPLAQGTTMGPLNNNAVARKVREHVEEAIAAKARCLTGGRPLPQLGSDLFYAPTVLGDVTPSMRVAHEETFGPVVPVVPLDGDDELLRVAKEGGYGLSIGIFSKDIELALAMSGELSAGITNINESTFYWETHMPFGGSSGSVSGTGRIGGRSAIEAMTEVRTLSIPVTSYCKP